MRKPAINGEGGTIWLLEYYSWKQLTVQQVKSFMKTVNFTSKCEENMEMDDFTDDEDDDTYLNRRNGETKNSSVRIPLMNTNAKVLNVYKTN